MSRRSRSRPKSARSRSALRPSRLSRRLPPPSRHRCRRPCRSLRRALPRAKMPDQAAASGAADPAGRNSDRAQSAEPAGEPPGRGKSVVRRRLPVRDEVVLPRDHAAVARPHRRHASKRAAHAVLLLSLTCGPSLLPCRNDNRCDGLPAVSSCSMSPPSRRCTRFSARCSIRSRRRRGRRRLRPAFPRRKKSSSQTRDGERVILWHVPPKAGRPVVIFLHGNGDILAWRVPRFRALTADGTGLVALSFRGYAGSSGKPTEQGLLEDGAAAYDFAAARYAPARIVPWGYSLGSGVASRRGDDAAGRRPWCWRRLTPRSWTSPPRAFPLFPVRLLMHDRFHSDRRIGALKAPLLVMHGEKDAVISVAFGRRLYELAPGPKRFVAFETGTHIDLDEQGAVGLVHSFLDEIRARIAVRRTPGRSAARRNDQSRRTPKTKTRACRLAFRSINPVDLRAAGRAGRHQDRPGRRPDHQGRRGCPSSASSAAGLRAAASCGRACGRGERLPPSRGLSFRRAFRNGRGASSRGKSPRAASSS